MTELSIVIPSWNTRELLAPCLDSLAAADLPAHEVLLVVPDELPGFGQHACGHVPEHVSRVADPPGLVAHQPADPDPQALLAVGQRGSELLGAARRPGRGSRIGRRR